MDDMDGDMRDSEVDDCHLRIEPLPSLSARLSRRLTLNDNYEFCRILICQIRFRTYNAGRLLSGPQWACRAPQDSWDS